MVESNYFSLRYAIPGFTLILVLLATNYDSLFEIIKRTGIESALGPFLGFVCLFTGSALGFLISQPWYIWRNHKGGVLGIEDLSGREVRYELIMRLGIKEDTVENRKKIGKIDAILDYILNVYEKNAPVWRYIQRRIDIYDTLSCTAISIFSGLALGLVARIYYEIYLWGNMFLIFSEPSRSLEAEFFAQLFIYLIFLVSAIVIWIWGRKNQLGNYKDMLIAAIRGVEDKDAIELQKLFL